MTGRVLWDPFVEGDLLGDAMDSLYFLAEALEHQSQIFKGPAPGVGWGLTDDNLSAVAKWDDFIQKLQNLNEQVHQLICDLNSPENIHSAPVRPVRELFCEMVVSLSAFIDPLVSAAILYAPLISRLELVGEACRRGMILADDYVLTLREERD